MYFIWFLMIVIAAFIGANKNRPVLGTMLGIMLGFIGVIIILIIPSKKKGEDNLRYIQGRDDKGIMPNPIKPIDAVFKD